MLNILNRVLVKQFYVRNAGTFLVIILLAFGFLSGAEHKALITAALGSPFLLAIVFGLWGLYSLKTTAFVRQQLRTPENLFLQTFWLMSIPKRLGLWLIVQIALLAPILAYGEWMAHTAISLQKWDSLLSIFLWFILLLITGVWLNDYRLRHPHPESLRLPYFTIKLPYAFFFPVFWLRYEPLSLVLTKAFSGLLLAGVCRLYPTDDYDQRLLLIGLLLAVLGHSQLGSQLSTFERHYLFMLPNLPLSWLQRFSRYVLVYGVIWLPDLFILLRNCPAAVRLDYIFWLWLTGWGAISLMHSLSYGQSVLPERWLSGIMASFIGGLLLIMFGLPVGAWFIASWLCALVFWHRTFYKLAL